MKKLQRLCATFVFVLILTNSPAFGDGIIHGDKTPPPPTLSSTGIIHGDFTAPKEEPSSESGTFDVLAEMTLSLAQSLLAVF